MAAKFELYKGQDGQFYFRLKAGNGEIIAVSEGYTSKASAKNGIESVKKNAPVAALVELSEAESSAYKIQNITKPDLPAHEVRIEANEQAGQGAEPASSGYEPFPVRQRVAGLGAGTMEMAPDFDDTPAR